MRTSPKSACTTTHLRATDPTRSPRPPPARGHRRDLEPVPPLLRPPPPAPSPGRAPEPVPPNRQSPRAALITLPTSLRLRQAGPWTPKTGVSAEVPDRDRLGRHSVVRPGAELAPASFCD